MNLNEIILSSITLTAALIAILNPVSTISYYLALHKNPDDKTVKKDTKTISLAVLGILLVSATVGSFILSFFGLKIEFFKIAGGTLLIFMAFDMARGKISGIKTTGEKDETNAIKNDYMDRGLVIPLAMPLTSGPGSIAYVISHTVTLKDLYAMIPSIFVASTVTYIILRYGISIQKFLGEIGIKLVTRFMGVILLGLGIQTVLLTALPLISK